MLNVMQWNVIMWINYFIYEYDSLFFKRTLAYFESQVRQYSDSVCYPLMTLAWMQTIVKSLRGLFSDECYYMIE